MPEGVTLVAVSKTYPAQLIQELYDLGHRDFGENRVQELLEKQSELPTDINWHLIGHLQSKKAKAVVGNVALVHSIDSIKLLEEVQKQAEKGGTKVSVLLQIYIAEEESKYGFSYQECTALLQEWHKNPYPNIVLRGLMGMATLTNDESLIKTEMGGLHRYYLNAKEHHFAEEAAFDTLSMGMSSDWHIALAAGSNMLRIGSSLFGSRA